MYGIPQSRRGQRSLSITVNTEQKNQEAPPAKTKQRKGQEAQRRTNEKGVKGINDLKDDDDRDDDACESPVLSEFVVGQDLELPKME